MGSYNSFEVTRQQVLEASRLLNLDAATADFLCWPQREFKFTLPVRMDNGEVKIFQAYRIQHNFARGPAKGGIRFHPDETADTIRALASWMTWKTAVVDIPLGGGKGGVQCDPRRMSQRELEEVSRVCALIAHVIGIDKDVPAPDVYTNPQTMAWMMDEYESIVQRHQPGTFTDKPISMGGTEGRRDATARGGVISVREACKVLGLNPRGTFAIQGFGNAGQRAALLHHEILGGGKLLAVCDSKTGIYNSNGLDSKELVVHKLKTGSLEGFTGGEQMHRDEVLKLDVDILYPAALENAINEENASKIRAKIICELANGPTTPEADHILFEKHAHVIPDILASAGGVIVSYFEMVQNSYGLFWEESEIHRRLDTIITKAYHAVQEAMKEKSVHPRLAAMVVGVARVATSCKLRGWV